MSIFQELDYNSQIDKITGVQFSVLSPDEIRRRSVAEIFTQEIYDGDKPKIGGLFDPRMGVLDHAKKCPTDQLDNRQCPGYFGHIELAMPVFHIQYQKYVLQTLKCVCWKCSKLLISPDDPDIRKIILKKKGVNRFVSVVSLISKVKRCGEKNHDGCGAPRPIVRKDNNGIGKIIAEWKLAGEGSTDEKKIQRIYWDASDIHKILRRISDEECEVMGFSRKFCRPDWLICSVFGVCPPSVRPSVRADNNTRMEDDLTHKLCDIVKTNRTLKSKLQHNAPKKVIDEWYQLLQYHIATFVDNTLPGIPPAQQRSGRALKSIKERLKSKEGRVRGNLMGKRVDYSARSVITPDPNISINELGVPEDIAKNLTYPEIVTKYNIEKLKKLVHNGYDIYPGAKSIKRIKDSKIISLKVIDTKNYNLEIGDILNRHLIDGDIVLFNRQPSLHKMSMMCHKVRVLKYKTFRLNVSVTTPYNADFDGDEMNMHVPQSIQTATELQELASVETQIITPATHKPIIALVQDSIIGSYLFTRYDNYLTKSEVLDLLIWIKTFDGNLPEPDIKKDTPITQIDVEQPWFPKYKYIINGIIPYDLWSGRTIFSLIIPDINMVKNNDSYATASESQKFMHKVIIDRGKVINGVFDKSILGTKEKGIVHIIYNEYGPERTKQFLDDAQNLITNWVLMSGFSVGLGDLIPDEQPQNKMKKEIIDKKKTVIELIEHVHKGILQNDSGKSNSEEYEMQVSAALGNAMNEAGKIGCKYLDSDNRMTNLVNSGSKGSNINIGQMIACVGQQSVDGKRIPYGFTDRTLPHFHKYDDGAAARGFVENSFVKGLTPTEFFFHAMGGREGLIDTAVKTSETGYIQRKLVKGMEDVRVEFDYTVRNANGHIIQFLYGEDGIDPTKIESQCLPTIMMNYDDIEKTYKIHNDDSWNMFIHDDEFDKLNDIDFSIREEKYNKYFKSLLDDKRHFIENINSGRLIENGKLYYPINLDRLVNNCAIRFVSKEQQNTSKTDLTPIYILEKIEELYNKLTITDNMFNENRLFMMLVKCWLSPNKLIKKLSMNRIGFDYIIGNIIQQFFNSISQPGDLVGVISAQSIGEPSTQMTLNTFHFAGVAGKSQVTRGLARFKELLSTTKNVKSPYLTIYLNQCYGTNKEKAHNIINEISIITIKQLINSSEIYFEPDEFPQTSLDKGLLDIYKKISEYGLLSESKTNPWVLRLNFDRKKMVDKNIKMCDLYYAIISKFNSPTPSESDDISCLFSDDNSSELIMRIKLKNRIAEDIYNDPAAPEEDTICILRTLENTILNDIELTGIKGVTNATMRKDSDHYIYDIETNSYIQEPEWVIETTGSNLIDIFKHPAVDSSRTVSNDIHEVYDVLGIEAARTVLINEIDEIFSQSSANVNHRHLSLLADVMTNKGQLMSIDRHGINKSDRGPLAKCSFEETPDIISRAAIFGELDKVNGVSSNIMLGQEVPVGTGSVDILFDEEKYFEISRNIHINDDSDDSYKIQENSEKDQFLDKLCKSDNFTTDLFDTI
tara:strand:+ start:7412 stop:11998 length:4587 start_codon:yes stop_codon:yes gene_type:complete